MSKIKILPVHLVNKIAAGECIERPASVVKELVENAIDAGASKIDVYLEQGGTKLIRVVDNGGGIDPDDLTLALTPHATSKLQDENDLYAILTMGFRGEALTSIGSVSILKIASVVPGRESGGAIEVDGGQVSGVKPYAGSPGTTLEVHNLFFNTPARRKFLKSPPTELGHCQEAVIRLALAYPNLAFNLYHGNRSLLQLPAVDSPRERIGGIFGSEIENGLVQVFNQSKDITFSAYVCRPDQAKSSANWQYFFVNRRAIRDRYLTHALRESYRGLMPPDRQPVGFLFLQLDPTLVDVNVHPAKNEVRFADSGLIHSLVLGSIRERFLSTDLTAELSMSGKNPSDTEPEKIPPPHQEKIKEALTDFLKSASHTEQARIPFTSSRRSPYPHSSPTPRPVEPPVVVSTPMEPAPANRVLQIHNSYLVVETADGLMIVDQHALHERILYQQLRGRVNAGSVPRQQLLMPELVSLTSDQMEQIEQFRESLARAGVEVEAFGPQTIAIHSLPAIVSQLNATAFMEELLSRVGKSAKVEPEQVLEHVLQSLACKAAVKAGDPLKPEEIHSLLALRESVDMSSSCPHGRPTALQMSLADLQKQFKRT